MRWRCGVLVYSKSEGAKDAKPQVVHIEGDSDNPINRGTLCARGAASLGFLHSPNRLQYPMHRKPGSDKFERVTWDFAMERIAKLAKEDRDKNFIAKNRDGVTVNRWLTTGFLAGSSCSNEAGYLTYKAIAIYRDTGVREPSTNLTRSDGGQSWPHIRTRCDDEQLERHQER